jgi:putative ABC transport system permease protein
MLRDCWRMKGQALAIALVISGGVSTLVMSISTLDSLKLTQSTFYRDYRFSEVFAALKRAPESLKPRIEAIPGVRQAETRVVSGAILDVEGYSDPVTCQIISLPDHGQPLMNQLYLKAGTTLTPGRDNEVLIGDAFAAAHRLHPGDYLHATINGKRKRLQIAGVALSPEHIFQLQPGSVIPDFKSFGTVWMARKPLASAYDLDGAFNNVTLSLLPEAQVESVIEHLDKLLEDYGGLGAYGRKDQISHRYVSEEFRQLEQMAKLYPAIFLGVSAFLLNVVVSRLIATQREQVAILKAFGYSNLRIVIHYLQLVVLIVLVGVLAGVLLGVWLGMGMSSMYMDFYRFPYLTYQLRPRVALVAALVSGAAAVLGTIYSVARAALQPPAEAMQPAPPARYRVSWVEQLGLTSWLSQPTRMIVRNLERRPIKAALSMIGIALACAILMLGGFFSDAVDTMVTIQFKLAQHDDMTVTFVEPTSQKALYPLNRLPGVEYAEAFRSVPARLRFQHRSYRTSIQGIPPNNTLRRLLNRRLEAVAVPPEGVLLTDYLATILGIRPGDSLTVEVLEGKRVVRQVTVAGLVSEYVGVAGYMDLSALNRLMREGHAISGAYLAMDPLQQPRVYSALKEMPRVAGTSVRAKVLENFYETMAKQVLTFALFITLLAGSIAFGVVYNSARIALSERSRELASLRVLGFTRGEISYILLGELAVLTIVAIPMGFLIGRALGAYVIWSLQTDLFRIPLVFEPSTYSFAATVVLVSAAVSGLIVRRKLDHLDLLAVLKTKE